MPKCKILDYVQNIFRPIPNLKPWTLNLKLSRQITPTLARCFRVGSQFKIFCLAYKHWHSSVFFRKIWRCKDNHVFLQNKLFLKKIYFFSNSSIRTGAFQIVAKESEDLCHVCTTRLLLFRVNSCHSLLIAHDAPHVETERAPSFEGTVIPSKEGASVSQEI